MASNDFKQEQVKIFSQLKNTFLDYDPAHFIQNNLTLDGEPFRIIGNGWKFMADVYRYVALQASKRDGRPVIIKKGRQVGATMMAGALDIYFTNSGLFTNPPIRVAHLFPAIAQVKRFTQDKLENLIRSGKDDFINKNKLDTSNAVDNLTMKQFNTGTLWVESVGADADRVRGMTLDVAFFDEVQDMVGLAIGNATKTLTAAKYGPVGRGVQVYFGTPKEKGSWFELTWEMSDQRYYHLGCKNCNQTFPFYKPNDDGWKSIWITGFDIKCPICGYVQHKIDAIERGEWVPTRSAQDSKYVGFHINQLYIPYLNREYINSLMPENNPNQSERVWNNEVIGEFYASVGMPLTRSHIEAYCKDEDRAFAKKMDQKDRATYLGIDWGDKTEQDSNGQSYSCAVILSDAGDGTLLIEHAHILKERLFSYKKATVNELFRRFSIRRGVSDFFFGQDIVRELQVVDGLRDRFLGAQGSGALSNPIKYREDDLMIGYNKDMMIEELFDKMKKGKIRFPWKSYEYVEWLIDHCTSMGVAIKTVGGQQVKTYVKGSTPNDGLMALMYAYMAWKFDSTQGFTIKPGTKEKSNMPKPTLAFSPRLR
jgi:Phage terminase large subunit (GpA)